MKNREFVKKKSKGDINMYRKRIDLNNLKMYEVQLLHDTINALGFTNIKDYRINAYNQYYELIILNQKLHKILKVIRKTSYFKTKI